METPSPCVYNKADNESNERPPTFGLNSFESTLSDFQTLFATTDLTKPENVFAQSLAGTLKNYHCRSIAWKVFLGCLDAGKTPAEWIQQITAKRMEYEALLKQHKTDPNNSDDVDPLLNNPLSQEAESPWTKFYEEQELLETIGKDTNRLYPVGCGEFFEHTQHATTGMTNVLFVWSQLHPETSYRQGMHELLAPFVWLMESERLVGDTTTDAGALDDDDGRALRVLLDPHYIEHDAYFMFTTMMSDVEQLFYVHAVDSRQLASKYREAQRMGATTLARRNRSETDAAVEAVTDARNKSVTPVLRTCNRIHHELLHVADPSIHKRMVTMEIEPQLYALPWVRLMFSRCFHMDDVLILWEGIFSATSSSQLLREPPPVDRIDRITEMIECIGVAMVMYVREYLLEAESMYMLQRLMKYPPVEDVSVFVQRAMEIRASPHKRFAPDDKEVARQQEASRRQQEASAAAAALNAAAVSSSSSSSSSTFSSSTSSTTSSTSAAAAASSFRRPDMAASKGTRSQFQGQTPPRPSEAHSMSLEERMGTQLGYISKVFETELCGKPEGERYDETIVLQALAQLKQVKDVLSKRIDESDCFWLYSIKETATAAEEKEQGEQKEQQEQQEQAEQQQEEEKKEEQEEHEEQQQEAVQDDSGNEVEAEEKTDTTDVQVVVVENPEVEQVVEEPRQEARTSQLVEDERGLFDDDQKSDEEEEEDALSDGGGLFDDPNPKKKGLRVSGLFGDDDDDDDDNATKSSGGGLFDDPEDDDSKSSGGGGLFD